MPNPVDRPTTVGPTLRGSQGGQANFKTRGLTPGVFAGVSKLFAIHPIVRSRTLASTEAYKQGTAALFLKAFNPYYSSIVAGQSYDRFSRYMDYSEMDGSTPECAAALNIYADECCLENEQHEMINISCENEDLKEKLEEFLYERLNLRSNLWHWIRNACKYGDYVLLANYVEGQGLINTWPIPVNEFVREEGFDAENPFRVRYRWNARANQVFEPWEIIHFRLSGKDIFMPYGTSILEPARRVWRQLVLLEDSMLVYRVVRAPERRVFYIEIGNTSPESVDSAMNDAIAKLKSQNIADDNGHIERRFHPMDVMTDYFLPKRGEVSSRIDTLSGGTMNHDIDDVEYMQRKLISALHIPRAFLGFEDALTGKATLAQEDVRFARTIQRVQQIISTELTRVAMIHLYMLGITDRNSLLDFELRLTNPSNLSELQKLDMWRQKLEVAQNAPDAGLPERWIHEYLFGFSESEYLDNKQQRIEDAKFKAMLEKVAEDVMNPPGEEGEEASSEEEPGLEMPEEGMDHDLGELGGGELKKARLLPADQGTGLTTLKDIYNSIVKPISDHKTMDTGWRTSLLRELKLARPRDKKEINEMIWSQQKNRLND